MSVDLDILGENLGQRLKNQGLTLVLAESCTGGGVAQAVTATPGSSAWFDRGFVTYSNVAKTEILDVNPLTLEQHGAVSEATALEMASGALAHSHADLALAITGIAGPDGGSVEKPVGTVFIAWQRRDQTAHCRKLHFSGNRQNIRQQVVFFCLQQILQALPND